MKHLKFLQPFLGGGVVIVLSPAREKLSSNTQF